MPAEVHLNDIGTEFRATLKDQDGVVVDISTASTRTMKFRKPTGVTVTKTAALFGTGTDGKMKYLSITGDLDVLGEWRVQGFVAIGAGSWHTDEYRFTVHPTL